MAGLLPRNGSTHSRFARGMEASDCWPMRRLVRVPQQHGVQGRQVHRFDEELLGSFLDGANCQFQRTLTGQNDDRNIAGRALLMPL